MSAKNLAKNSSGVKKTRTKLEDVMAEAVPTTGETDTQSKNGKQTTIDPKAEASIAESEKIPEEKAGADNAKSSNPATPTLSEFQHYKRHVRTVEIATRLACAQITAEAYSKSARLTVSGNQRIAAAFVMASARIKMDLENLRSNPDLIDAAFVDRAYADLMRAAEVNELPIHQAIPLNHPDHDDLFEGAMFRAHRLLKPLSEDTTVIHAEQLFEAEETLSETQVGKIFEKCAWPGLANRDDFYPFIVRVERWFSDHLGRLHFPEEDELYEQDAEMMESVLNVGRRRQENDLFRQIYELVKSHKPPNQPRGAWTDMDDLHHAIWTQCIINVIFCGRSPSHTRENERIIRRYRPWGLFRFLRIHGANDPIGSDLLKSLVCERRNLTLDAVVHPFRQNYPLTYDFGPLDRLVKELEREDMQKFAIQRVVNSEAASGLLEAVHAVETLPKPITEKFQKDVLGSARSGNCFDPKWTGTIKDGFKAILLAGTEFHMHRLVGFLTKFYLPLLDAYGALDAVVDNHYTHELIDLFPDGWSFSLSRKIPESTSPPDASTINAEGPRNSQAAEAMTLTLRNSAGKELSVLFHRSASLNQSSPDEVSDDLSVDHGVEKAAPR